MGLQSTLTQLCTGSKTVQHPLCCCGLLLVQAADFGGRWVSVTHKNTLLLLLLTVLLSPSAPACSQVLAASL